MSGFTAQELAKTAWAFEKMGRSDEKLFAALARSAQLQESDLNMQAIAKRYADEG